MKKLLWTSAGIAKLARAMVELDAKIKSDLAMSNIHGGPSGGLNEEQLLERADDIAAHNIETSRLKELGDLWAQVEAAPAPNGDAISQVGHLVGFRYVESSLHRKKGDRGEFILGGEGEFNFKSTLPTVSTASPIGKALLGIAVGSQVDVVGPEGEYRIEVTRISTPENATNVTKIKAA